MTRAASAITSRVGVTALLVAVALSSHGASENYRSEVVARHGAWTTIRVVDTFDDAAVGWAAYHAHGDAGSVRYTCTRGEGVKFTAHADNMFIDSIGQAFSWDPIRIRVRVDGNPIIESEGKYPNDIAVDGAHDEIHRQFIRGRQARIRTEHGSEQHTFLISLNGFATAAKWVQEKCGGRGR